MSLPGSSPTRLPPPLTIALAALFLLVAFGAGGHNSATAAGVGDCTPGAGWGTARKDLAAEVVSLVNQHRAGLGLGSLAVSPTLTAAADWKAQHMAFLGYLGHADPAPPIARSVADRLAACGYAASGWGENIAQGYQSAAAVMQGWLSSPGHKANIEGSSFRAIGVGVAAAANGRLSWVQAFGAVADTGAPPAPVPPPAPPAPSVQTTSTAAVPAAAPVPAVTLSRSNTQRPVRLEASTLLQWGPRPRAGRRFTGRLTVSAPDTRRRVRSGHATCKARVGGRPVWVGIHRFRNGFVVCRWQLPRTAKGKRMIGMIRVWAGGKQTARWFSRPVR